MVLTLGLDEVHDRLGQRPVVADRPCEHERHIRVDQCLHDSVCDDALLDGGADAAVTTHAVDRADVVAVAASDDLAAGQVEAHHLRGEEV